MTDGDRESHEFRVTNRNGCASGRKPENNNDLERIIINQGHCHGNVCAANLHFARWKWF
jgi:hypothetical protein